MATIDYTDKNLYPYGKEGIQPGQPYIPYGSITGESLTPQQDLSSQVSSPTYPNYAPTTLPQLQATPAETQQSELLKTVQGINTSLAGKPAYQQEQEQQLGIQQKTQAITDLQNQFYQIQGEQAALKAREAQISPGLDLRLQEGRSAYITEFTRGRQEEKARRELAIEGLSLSARAATTGALFQAAQGNLAAAQTLVDKAVRDKFATQEAQRDALLQNLQLIQNDPETTRQDKNRALQQQQSLQAQQDIIKESKQNYQANLELANSLVKQGVQDTILLQKIQEAKDVDGNYSVAEAQRIAAESGLFTKAQAVESVLSKEPVKAGEPSVTLQRILYGGGSLAGLTPTEKTKVQNEAFELGLYESSPREWFKEQIQEQLQSSVTKEELARLWEMFRKPMVSTSSVSEGVEENINPFR